MQRQTGPTRCCRVPIITLAVPTSEPALQHVPHSEQTLQCHGRRRYQAPARWAPNTDSRHFGLDKQQRARRWRQTRWSVASIGGSPGISPMRQRRCAPTTKACACEDVYCAIPHPVRDHQTVRCLLCWMLGKRPCLHATAREAACMPAQQARRCASIPRPEAPGETALKSIIQFATPMLTTA